MKIYVDRKPENCNHCIFNQNVSKYLNVEDYCILNKKNIGTISIDKDCPLVELKKSETSELQMHRKRWKKERGFRLQLSNPV